MYARCNCEERRCHYKEHGLLDVGKFIMSYFWFGLTTEAFAYSLCIKTLPQSKHKKPFSDNVILRRR